jgi:hypothetical protein
VGPDGCAATRSAASRARAGDRTAIAQAKRLNPLSPELQEFANESGGIDIGVGG